MAGRRIQRPTTLLSGLLADVHRLATGRGLRLNKALDYVGDTRRLASAVAGSRILADSSKCRKLEALLTESRHGV
jgi:hypothetical protein